MYNEKKIKKFKNLVTIIISISALVIGFVVGNFTATKKETSSDKQTKVVKQETTTLSTTDVKKFLIAYYTKKDLSENRNRYKPLMTDAMYNQTVTEEDLPVNQAYKGYVINQVFDDAAIYVDSDSLTAIADVKYHNTQLSERNTTKNAVKDANNTESIKLTFIKSGKTYKVNTLTPVILTEPGTNITNNNYESETEDSTTSTTTSTSQSDTTESSSEEEVHMIGGLG